MSDSPQTTPQTAQNRSEGGSRATGGPARIGPSSVLAEESVLGSALISAEVIPPLTALLQPEDFFELKHGWIWEAILALYDRNDDVDYLTVVEELRRRPSKTAPSGAGQTLLDDVGGSAYLTYLVNSTPTHVYAETYARIVEVAAVRRRLMDAAGMIAQAAKEENQEIGEIISRAEAALFKVVERRAHREITPMAQAVREYVDRIEELYKNPSARMGVPTGFSRLDEMMGGMQRSDLIIVAARPGVGKTSFLLGVAFNAARRGARVAIFSLEMGREQIMQRLYAMESGINSQRLRLGKLEDHEWQRFVEVSDRLIDLPIFIDDTPGLTVQQIGARCQRLYREYGVDLVILDYLQLMTSGISTKQENRVQEVSYISRNLKELARKLNVPIVAAAQLSRAVEQRSDKRPQLSDLRESGSIEQDADLVVFLYRDELYNENTERPNQADVIVAKHRNGPTGIVTLHFKKELTKFTDLELRTVDLSSY